MAINKVRIKYDAYCGLDIEQAYDRMSNFAMDVRDVLIQYHSLGGTNELTVFCNFNGVEINTDMTLDECYKAVCGMTKAELDEIERQEREEYKRKKEEHEKNIPSLVESMKERAKPFIKEDKWDYFCEILPNRYGDLYSGFEMESMLSIIQMFEQTKDMDQCAKLFYEQGHSGMSAGLVSSLVKEFYSEELGQYVYDNSLKFANN